MSNHRQDSKHKNAPERAGNLVGYLYKTLWTTSIWGGSAHDKENLEVSVLSLLYQPFRRLHQEREQMDLQLL